MLVTQQGILTAKPTVHYGFLNPISGPVGWCILLISVFGGQRQADPYVFEACYVYIVSFR